MRPKLWLVSHKEEDHLGDQVNTEGSFYKKF